MADIQSLADELKAIFPGATPEQVRAALLAAGDFGASMIERHAHPVPCLWRRQAAGKKGAA